MTTGPDHTPRSVAGLPGRSRASGRSRISGLLSILSASAMMSLCPAGSAQVNVEAVARLHFTIEAGPGDWFEGYQAMLSGSFSPYASHRSGGRRDSAYVARTLGEESVIGWSTAPVPPSWTGDSASFLWVCGFGNNLGRERFDLVVDDADTLSFTTSDDAAWTVRGARGASLSFVAAAVNPNGANLGYMALTLPRSAVRDGRPVTIRVRGVPARTEIWYRLFAYGDAIRYLRSAEDREFFSRVELLRNGDASLALCAGSTHAGSPVRLLLSGTEIGKGRLQADGLLARTTVLIPRGLQPSGDQPTAIEVGGMVVDTLRWTEIVRRRLEAFLLEELECERYVFPPGALPEVRWKNPEAVGNEMGSFPLGVEYYDGQMRRVSRADSAGRYAAVVEAKLPSGFTLRRFMTLYCSPVEFDDYSAKAPIAFNPLRGYGIDEAQWRMYGRNENRFSFGSMKMFPAHDPDAAVFLAGLSELDSAAIPYDTPRLRDRQWWIAFKQTLHGTKAAPLSPPKKDDRAGPLLDEHPASASPFSQAQLEQIRAVCRDWAAETGVPHVTLVAHKGKVVFHEAFNAGAGDDPVDLDSPIWMASITKLLTGALMMEFVDQRLVDLDAPVARYLSELPDPAAAGMTVRQLFTHTTGLEEWGGEWASDWNQALENYVAQAIPLTAVGKRFSYNRAGYAVAGKVMERLTGRAVPYLFQDYIFTPLGMKSAFADNTYGGLYCTAADLARLGQMLLNRGTYDGYAFFSADSWRRMLPAGVEGTDRRWGIGTSPMDEPGLSEEAFGHAAASGAMFRVDPGHDLVIISARNRVGGNQEEFEKRLVGACTAPFRDR